jgi:pimeloyl-ACP methyl ester carboxylesterase
MLRCAAPLLIIVAAAVVTPAAGTAGAASRATLSAPNQTYIVPYLAWNGQPRDCVVLLPRDYAGGTQKLPCIVTAHARGATPLQTSRLWQDLPTAQRFMVVCAGSAGRVDPISSWSCPGQIADLMELPGLIAAAMPWLRIDMNRLYVAGVSMGGAEALSVAARYPDRVAAAASFDGVADLAAYYRALPATVRVKQQRALRREVGGPPRTARFRYALRSPLSFAATLATSGVPLGVWWSTRDLSVRYQATQQTGRLCKAIRALRPDAPLVEAQTTFAHGFALRDDPQRLLSFLRPLGVWRTRPAKAPAEWSYSSWLPDVSVWDHRFLTGEGLRSFWHVTVTADQVIASSSQPLTVQVPWTERVRAVSVTIDGAVQQIWPRGGLLTLPLPAGETTAIIAR